jgi:hypothetical protein
VAFVLGITSSRLLENIWSGWYNIETKTHPLSQFVTKKALFVNGGYLPVHCYCPPIGFLSVWERMRDPPSRKSLEPKPPLENLCDRRCGLTELFRNNCHTREQKLLKEGGESLSQKMKGMSNLRFVLAWKVACREAATPLSDLIFPSGEMTLSWRHVDQDYFLPVSCGSSLEIISAWNDRALMFFQIIIVSRS